MGVLHWMQNKLHGSHHRRRTSEFVADSARSVDPSTDRPQTDKLNDGLNTAMLSIGTFGMREGHRLKNCERFDELTKLQEELKSLVRARAADTADDPGRIIWGLLLKSAHPENSSFTDPVMRDHRAVQMAPKVKAEVEDDGGKWIRTDSEYIVLEI
ncbi:hypothetical protein HU200_025665 [Digitaria exilis]|uniref:Uncharacterized protein n=1 Tax=Digitaria exilis TaxID=1010633 RepID=A0A835EV82_9POAL|nr:hypothetical protein HU200_025665 [Digitaria exilis]